MATKWINNSAPNEIISIFNQGRSIKNGKVSFEAFSFEPLASAISTYIEFSEAIPNAIRRQLVVRAIFDAGKAEITPHTLLDALNSQQSRYLRKVNKKLVVVTTLSASGPPPFKQLSFDGVRFSFPKRIEKYDRSKSMEAAKHMLHSEQPSGYQPVLARLHARSEDEAIERSLSGIDTIRAIWNLSIMGKVDWRISHEKRRPINELTLGPLHTVHTSDGRTMSERYWYEPSFVGNARICDFKSKANQLRRSWMSAQRKLRNSRLKKQCVKGLQMYVQAFDQYDFATSFVKLWSALEYLTGTQNDRYEITVRRAASMFKDHKAAKEILQHLRVRRNSLVHTLGEHNDIETITYQLKVFVETLLQFYVRNPFDLQNQDEVRYFLDLPRDSSIINRRAELVRFGRKFMI